MVSILKRLKVSQRRRNNYNFLLGSEMRVINKNLGNVNLQRIVVCMDKFQDNFFMSDKEYDGYYTGIN